VFTKFDFTEEEVKEVKEIKEIEEEIETEEEKKPEPPAPAKKPEEKPFTPSGAPARIISDYSFLLNRLVLQDVYSTTGELIIPANSKISVQTVETARRYGKLVELTVGSRLMNF
jgi:hypothetical protein